MQDIQVKVKVNSQIEGGELTAAVPLSTKMNQDQTNTQKLSAQKDVAPIVFQPPPATEELVKGKEEESIGPTAASNESGAAPVSKKQKKVNDDTNNLASKGLGIAEGQGRPSKSKPSSLVPPPQFNPGLGLGYAPGLPGQMPLLVPSFNHHMYGSYPWKAIYSGGVGGAHSMYHPQTSAAGVAHSAPMYGQAILQTVSTDSQTDPTAPLVMNDEIKDELAGIKKDVTMMKDMVSHLLIQNKELLIQNKELMEKIGN